MAGDATLFLRRDEVEVAWNFIDAIREGWEGVALSKADFYRAGSWGPEAADELVSRLGHAWREPSPLERTDRAGHHK
jgi:glucose-6-phosphate 1-dehydrogenase